MISRLLVAMISMFILLFSLRGKNVSYTTFSGLVAALDCVLDL